MPLLLIQIYQGFTRAYLVASQSLWYIDSAAQTFKLLQQSLLIGLFEQKHPATSVHWPV